MDCKKHSAFIGSFIKFDKAPMYSIMRLAPAHRPQYLLKSLVGKGNA